MEKAMTDPFHDRADDVGAPARHVAAFTPSDTADLPDTPKALYVGTGGDVTLIAVDAPADAGGVTFRNLPSGALLPVRARRVMATGTTAADLLVLL
jgi:hypothetical protein